MLLEGQGDLAEEVGWQGCDRVVLSTRCEVTLSSDRNVIAMF